jgi:hypothetical protein
MLVGVLGFIGSGKGTVGDILEKYNFQKVSFASTLKDIASKTFDWPRHLLEGDTEESRLFREKEDPYWSDKLNRKFTPRIALQYLGTEVFRDNFHTDFWILCLEKKIKHLMHEQNFVVTDVRFPNEMNWIDRNNGLLIEVHRGIRPHWFNIAAMANKGDPSAEKFMRQNTDVHESEWRWVGHEDVHTIKNDGTIQDLEDSVRNVLSSYLGKSTIEDTFKENLL